MPGPRKKSSVAWEHFQQLSKNEVMCMLCCKVLTYSMGSTSPMLKHLRLHSSKPSSKSSPASGLSSSPASSSMAASSSSASASSASASSASASMQQTSMAFQVRNLCDPLKASAITQMIGRMIVDETLSPSFVETKGFRDLMNYIKPTYTVPSQTAIKAQLQFDFQAKKNVISHMLSKVDSVSVTADRWTSASQEEYMTVTVHYIDDKWERKAAVLDTSPCIPEDDDGEGDDDSPHSHVSSALANQLKIIVEAWNIAGKTCAVVHDNTINVDEINEGALGAHDVSCAANTLQFSVYNALESHHSIKTLIGAANKLVRYFRHSDLAGKTLDGKQEEMDVTRPLTSSCKTRWISVYVMMERLLESRWLISNILSDRDLTESSVALSLELQDLEWQLMEDLVSCLQPFQVATTVLSAEENAGASIVLPVISTLLEKHCNVKEGDNEAIAKFKETVATELMRWYAAEEQLESPTIMASALDPRYKQLPFLVEEQREKVGASIKAKLEEWRDTKDQFAPTSDAEEEEEEEEPAAKKHRVSAMDFLMGVVGSEDEVTNEYDDFLAMPPERNTANPLYWWRANESRFQGLAHFARKYLSIPATSIPTERAFAREGDMVTMKRSCLTQENVNLLVFLNANSSN